MKTAFSIVLLLLIGAVLVVMVAEMPEFGSPGPAYNNVAEYYLENSVPQTGAANIISAIILDYRGYDTMGEATVLFAGIAAVLATLAAHQGKKGGL